MTSFDTAPDEALTPEQRLALVYAPAGARLALAALWTLDDRLRRLVANAREPGLAQIKLAWWQERLAALGDGPAPAEPLLRSLSPLADTTGVAGLLSALASSWREIDGSWSSTDLDAHADLRGRSLLTVGAAILGAEAGSAHLRASQAAALHDLASSAPRDRRASIVAAARGRFVDAGTPVWPRVLRPIGMLVLLARHDARTAAPPRQGSPARVARMAWHALSGR